jgi:single-stranded-DNA-specific exonuclease
MSKTARPDTMLVQRYTTDFSIPRELAQIIASRFPVYTDAQAYLCPKLSTLHDPGLLPDIEKAADRIVRAVHDGTGILVYCHDDVDGYTSGVIMYTTLSDIMRNRAQPLFLYPVVREKDGYILNPEVLKEYHSKGARIIITVDFGVSSSENFKIAREQDMELIVCDHHEVKADTFTVPVVDPKRPASTYPFRDLAGVGVTLKLAQFLYRSSLGLGADEFFNLKKEFIALSMLGTIADRVILTDENRILCRYGMDIINQLDVPWAKYFTTNGEIDMAMVIQTIIPTISSAAYCDPMYGVGVFLNSDKAYVRDTFAKLRNVTDERRKGVAIFFEDVISAARVYPDVVISVVPVVRQHYLGSVAGWLRDRYKRTALVIGIRNGRCIGELRSHRLNLYEMLHSMGDFFSDYGGHQKAAGFTMVLQHLDELVDRVLRYVTAYTHEAEKKLHEPIFRIARTHADMLKPMMPFGEGNSAPLLTDGTLVYTIDNKLNIVEKGSFDGKY